jgi:siroheme synthase-like protein
MPSASETTQHYVACLDLTGRRVVLVGSSPQKEAALRASGAELIVAEEYNEALLDGAWLVVCVDRAQGERVAAGAAARRIFCNVEDVPELCTFILPALHRRGPITVAVSTGGASPVLAQWLRDRFAAQIGPEHEELARELRALRPWVKRTFATYAERRDYFRKRVAEALR